MCNAIGNVHSKVCLSRIAYARADGVITNEKNMAFQKELIVSNVFLTYTLIYLFFFKSHFKNNKF